MRTNTQKISKALGLYRLCCKAVEGDRRARQYMARLYGRRIGTKRLLSMARKYQGMLTEEERELEGTQWMIVTHWNPATTREMLRN